MAFEAIEGGNLVVAGHSTGPLLTKPVEVALEVKSFSAVNAPLMTQLLSMASLTQLMHSLKNEGLEFSSVTGNITLDGSRLSIGKLRAVGGSMGLTADGWTDLQQHSLDFSGAILPLHVVSNVVGKIPLLGKIMVGDDGKGIVSMDYKLKGNFDQPKVSVQPGSLLTPGILKNLFNLGEKTVDEVPK